MRPMHFRLTSTTDTWDVYATCWTDLMDSLDVLTLSSLIKIERLA
jgi:hypothetical protein